jgi:hypothetical protein
MSHSTWALVLSGFFYASMLCLFFVMILGAMRRREIAASVAWIGVMLLFVFQQIVPYLPPLNPNAVITTKVAIATLGLGAYLLEQWMKRGRRSHGGTS